MIWCITQNADESDDESVISEDNEDTGDTFMQSYSDALNEELKATTLKKTFVRANEQSVQKKDEVGVFKFIIQEPKVELMH